MRNVGQHWLNEAAGNPIERHHDRYIIRQEVGNYGADIRSAYGDGGEQIDDGSQEAEQLEQKAGRPVEKRVDEADPIRQAQPTGRQRSQRRTQDLHKPEAPTAALCDIFFHPFWCEADAKRLIEVTGTPAKAIKPQGEQEILGDAIRWEAAAAFEGAYTDDRRGTAAEGTTPRVLRGQDVVKEEALLVRPDVTDDQVGLDRVAIEKVLRCLHEPDPGVMEQWDGAPQEVTMRHKISVENGDEFGWVRFVMQDVQSMIDVAG